MVLPMGSFVYEDPRDGQMDDGIGRCRTGFLFRQPVRYVELQRIDADKDDARGIVVCRAVGVPPIFPIRSYNLCPQVKNLNLLPLLRA